MSKLEDLARGEAEKRVASGSGIAAALEAMYPHNALEHYRKGGFIAGAKWAVNRVTEEQIAERIAQFWADTDTPEDAAKAIAALYRGEES